MSHAFLYYFKEYDTIQQIYGLIALAITIAAMWATVTFIKEKAKNWIEYNLFIFLLVFSLLWINIDKSTAANNIEGSVTKQCIPKWEEFCPKEYLSVDKKPGALVGFSLFWKANSNVSVNFPKWTEHSYNVYWAKRHKGFVSEMNACLKDKDNSEKCYERTRQKEQAKQASWLKLQQFYTNAYANALVYEVERAKDKAETLEELKDLGKEAVMIVPLVLADAMVSTVNGGNPNNYSYNYQNSHQNNSTNSDKQERVNACINRCSQERIKCCRNINSTASFGNNISTTKQYYVARCEKNYSECVSRCSRH